MGTNDVTACSACPGTEALARAQTDLATAAQNCENAVKLLSMARGSRSHLPDLSFLSCMLRATLASLDVAGEMLAELQGDLCESPAKAMCDA